MLGTTVPQYTQLLAPLRQLPFSDGTTITHPRLYFAPLVLFVVWGCLNSLTRLSSWRHLSLLAWFGGSSVAVLLTTRADAHRLMLLTVPLTLWAALGLREAVHVLRRAGVGRAVRHAMAVALIGSHLNSDILLVWGAPARPRLPGGRFSTKSSPCRVRSCSALTWTGKI